MSKKTPAGKTSRTDPKNNKSLAIRIVLKKMPDGKAADIAAAVKKEFGHDVRQNMIYMVKTKTNMASDGRAKKSKASKETPLHTAALWVEAIKYARQLLKSTGSVANATALLKAIDA